MPAFWKTLLKGVATVLPILVTLYVLYWIGTTLEFLMGGIYKFIFPGTIYFPGLGLLGGIALLYAVGLLIERGGAFQKLSDFADKQFERIPLVKTLYGGLRDLMQFFSNGKEGKLGQQVVLVTLGNGVQLIGFITGETVASIHNAPTGEETVTVYVPLSYQIGGFTVYVPRSSTKPLDMSVQDAMKVVLTGGVGKAAQR